MKGNEKRTLFRGKFLFYMEKLKVELEENIKIKVTFEYPEFESIFIWVFPNHVPVKNKILRLENSPFMTKVHRKAIMLR